MSLVRSNRNGFWVYQVALLKIYDAYVFGNTDLNSLEEEISSYRSVSFPMFYHDGLKKFVKPVLLPLLQHADQPERREIFGTNLGQGKNHACWRYSLNYKAFGHFLHSCSN